MCIWRETQEKARQGLAFSPVSKPHTHITYMLRQCTSIVYAPLWRGHLSYMTTFLLLNGWPYKRGMTVYDHLKLIVRRILLVDVPGIC